MKKLIPKFAKWGGLIVFGIAAFFFAQQLPTVNADALASLGGVVVGALITVAAQSWGGVLERKHQLRLAAAEKRLEAHQFFQAAIATPAKTSAADKYPPPSAVIFSPNQ